MGKPTVKPGYILLIIVFALLTAFLASVVVFRNGAPEKVSDTTVRARLLKARQNIGLAGFLDSASNERYSSMIYDVAVGRPGKGPLPWASSIPAGPDGRYDFTWRLKVGFKALFSIKGIGGEDPALSVKLVSSKGLPLYNRTMGISIPAENVSLSPGIYVLNVSSNQPLSSLEMSFAAPRGGSAGLQAPSSNGSMREINLKFSPRSMKDLKRLVSFATRSTDTMIVKMPGARVRSEISYDNKRIGRARVGLSGRSRGHLTWFPSIDIKLSGGRSIMGMPSFKLYRLDTKTGILEFAVMSVLQDMGFFMPRHELVILKVNGESQGVYLLMETTTQAMFANGRRLEGDIVGVDLEKLFFDYPYGAELDSRYFFKVRDTGHERTDKSDFFSSQFVEKVNPQELARYIAFTGVYLSAHGLGIDDLRFYMNPETGLFSPLPRDMNLSFLSPNSIYVMFFSHAAWITGEPPYTVWPVKKLYRSDYSYDRSKGVFFLDPRNPTVRFLTDIHPEVVSFVSKSKNLALVNRYFKFFLDNDALRTKMLGRALLATRKVIEAGGNSGLIMAQRKALLNNTLANFDAAKEDISFMWDKPRDVRIGKKRFQWNMRTSPDQDETLSPALFEPVDLSWDNKRRAHEMSLALSVESQIFKILDEGNMGFIKRSFRPLGTKERLASKSGGGKKDLNLPIENAATREVLDNVATYLMTRTTDKGRGIVAFLVRNDTRESGDYSIVARGGVTETRPVINKVFYAASDKGVSKASMEDILKKHFVKGERLRLLVFDLPLGGKPVFYRLKAPENGFFLFPPYMYLPSRSSFKTRTAAMVAPSPEWTRVEADGLHVPAGSVVTLDKTVTLDAGAGKGVFIEEGVTFNISRGAGLIVKSDLHVMGTEESPVRFLSMTDKAWGGLFAGRDVGRIDVSVKNAVFDNYGTYPKTSIGGLKLNGGITMVRASLKMDNVEIKNARGEDALNLVNSTALLRNVVVSGSFSDSIDLDFSDARLEKVTIERAGGDGLDISNSLVLCLDSVFKGSADKGISIGEMSHMVVNDSQFIKNGIGIANKDQSFLKVDGSSFVNNNTAISEFIKKPWFGRPGKALGRNTYKGNRKKYTWLGFHTY